MFDVPRGTSVKLLCKPRRRLLFHVEQPLDPVVVSGLSPEALEPSGFEEFLPNRCSGAQNGSRQTYAGR